MSIASALKIIIFMGTFISILYKVTSGALLCFFFCFFFFFFLLLFFFFFHCFYEGEQGIYLAEKESKNVKERFAFPECVLIYP